MSRRTLFLAALMASTSLPAAAQQPPAPRADSAASRDSTRIVKLAPIGVTATRTPTQVVRTPVPILVIDSSVIRSEMPDGVADLFRNLPGVDVTGVGPNQGRLIIRGQRGQRILLTEDGIRLNNARRQQDFGELPALTDVNSLARVEVVRGPASVLYGTDAIGGVVNQVSLEPPRAGRNTLGGSVFYRHNTADAQDAVHARIAGRSGRFGFGLSSTIRSADPYAAPAGSFGNLELTTPTVVRDAGVRDRNHTGTLSADLGDHADLSVRVSRYEARDAGFGYVDPAALGDASGVVVRLLYPEQNVTRATTTYRNRAVGSALADRLAVTFSVADNDRVFDQAIDIPFTPTAGMTIRSHNVTDIQSYGARVEATRILAGRHTLTYGGDWYLDRSTNTDSSETRMFGFGPPSTRIRTVPTLPNATYWTGGLFAQGRLALGRRVEMGAGIRAQTIRAETRATDGLPASRAGVTASNGALVGHLNGQLVLGGGLHLVATVGRAFRAPNLIERYFDGATAEGNGYQVGSPDLVPETSTNVDLGFKFRSDRVHAELTYFTNTIHNGIRIVPLDSMVGTFPAFQNRNIERLRDRGVEALAEVGLGRGFSVLGHVTTLDSKNVDRSNPVGDSYGTKLGGEVGWRDAPGRVAVSYQIRHQGERKDIELGTSPVGAVLPAFTVHGVRGHLRLPSVAGAEPSVELAVTNLTNVLYAEASNTSFFRPEPPRSLLMALRFDF